MLFSMVASFGIAWQGNAELKATTKSVKGQGLALLPSQPPRSGFVQGVLSVVPTRLWEREGVLSVLPPRLWEREGVLSVLPTRLWDGEGVLSVLPPRPLGARGGPLGLAGASARSGVLQIHWGSRSLRAIDPDENNPRWRTPLICPEGVRGRRRPGIPPGRQTS